MTHTNYLTHEDIIYIHDELLKLGGTPGLRDIELFDSAVMRPHVDYYGSLEQRAAALMESLAMNHPFADGNKRTAIFAADTFLRMNGYYLDIDSKETYELIKETFEEGTFTFELCWYWIGKHLEPLT